MSKGKFKLVIKHYDSGQRRFFHETRRRIRQINGDVFDALVNAPACERVVVKEA